MNRFLDIQDLFAAGVGLDISGAYLVAQGLLLTPRDVARLTGTYLGFNPHEAVARSRDRIDVATGLAILVMGFLLQSLGYVLSVSGLSRVQPSAEKAIPAAALVLVSVILSLMIARLARQPLLLSYLVKVSRFDKDGKQLDHPLNERLVAFAKALGCEPVRDEDDLEFGQRVFGKRRVRDMLVQRDSGYASINRLRLQPPENQTHR